MDSAKQLSVFKQSKVIRIKFYKSVLQALYIDGKEYVAIKPICEALGLNWASQFKRIKSDEILNSVVVVTTTTGRDKKQYEMVVLPIDKLNGWLFGISEKRVKPELKNFLVAYKLECYDVLFNYFHKPKIKAKQNKIDAPWKTLRDIYAENNKLLNAQLPALEDYIKETNPDSNYVQRGIFSSVQTAIYGGLGMTKEFRKSVGIGVKNFRDTQDSPALGIIANIEYLLSRIIPRWIAERIEYHEIFARIRAIAGNHKSEIEMIKCLQIN
jgi:P22_AR N-terminal domain